MEVVVVNSRFSVQVDKPCAVSGSEFNHCGIIPIHLAFSPFQDLLVLLYCTEKKDGTYEKKVEIELKESGWGIPALISVTPRSMYNWINAEIDFSVECALQLRIGSMDKDGIKLPIPFPTYQVLITGCYNPKKMKGYGDYRRIG